jgi:hypothetical protein
MQQYMYQKNNGWKFLICVAILEIIIAVIASTGLGLNVLATSNGTADVKLLNTSAVIGTFYAHVSLKTDGYQFSGHFENFTNSTNQFYSYKSAYHDNCGKNMPSLHNMSRNCDVRYAVWQWSRAYTALGTIAVIIVFATGIALIFFVCCGELLTRCCCGNGKDQRCCMCLCSCAVEIWLLVLNFLVFIMFAFSWGIILGLKFNTHLKSILANEANQALNQRQSIETYDFTFHTIKVGKSLWPLAAADLVALILTFYLLIMLCCGWCRNCENCDKRMRCDYGENNQNCQNNQNRCNYGNTVTTYERRCRNKNSTIEMACDDVQV